MIKTKVISKQPGEKRAINGSKELEQSKPKKCCQTITNTSMIKTMFAPTWPGGKIYARFGTKPTHKGRKKYYPWHNLAQKCAAEGKFGQHWSPTPATSLWTARWTHSRPTIQTKTLTRANAILAGRWYRLPPHTLPSLLMHNSRKVARHRQAPRCPAPLWMERQRWWCPQVWTFQKLISQHVQLFKKLTLTTVHKHRKRGSAHSHQRQRRLPCAEVLKISQADHDRPLVRPRQNKPIHGAIHSNSCKEEKKKKRKMGSFS